MKKIYYILALAMVGAMSFTSCSKEEPENPAEEPEPQEEVKYNVRLVAPLTDVQLEIMDLTVNYTVGDLTGSSTPAKMQTLSLPMTEAIFSQTAPNSAGKPTVYFIDLPGEYTEEELLNGTVEYVATGKKEGIAKYVNGDFNMYGRPWTFVKPVDEDWDGMDEPEKYEYMANITPIAEDEIELLIQVYNDNGAKKDLWIYKKK